MNGTFWNFKGLGDTKKFKFLSDLTIEKKSRFYCLIENKQEGMLRNFSKNFL